MTQRLLISVPVEPDGNVVVHLAAWLQLLRHETKGWDIDIDIAYVQAKPVASTRNRQVREFLLGECDYFLTIDNDAVPDTEGLRLLMEDIRKPEVDLVVGYSFLVAPDGPVPVVQKYHEDGSWEVHEDILSRDRGLHEIPDGGGGAHCLMSKRSTLERFFAGRVVWFKDVLRDHSLERPQLTKLLEHYKDNPAGIYEDLEQYLACADQYWNLDRAGDRMVGQDTWHFLRARELGMRTWVDTRVCWGHMKFSDIRAEFIATNNLRYELELARKELSLLKNGKLEATG